MMDFKEVAEKNKILELRVGSHLFGTNTADSDLDLAGIFMPCHEMVYGLQNCEVVGCSTTSKDDTGRNTADAIDKNYYEYRKFVKLAIQNNPNILHILFVDNSNINYMDSWGATLLNNKNMFPHKGAYRRFVAYADSQRHKMLIKPENYKALQTGLEILESKPDNMVMAELKSTNPFKYGGTGNHLRLGDIHIELTVYVKKARRMVKDRLAKASSRSEMFTKYGFDLKFASNLIQLLFEGIELMETGEIKFPLDCREHILAVKHGMYTAHEIQEWADQLVEESRQAYEKSSLPINPPVNEIEKFVIHEIRSFMDWDRTKCR